MTLTVQLFARAKDLAGRGAVQVELDAAATVADLRRCLMETVPALAGLVPRSAIAVNNEYAHESTTLTPGDEVALLPPVSGG